MDLRHHEYILEVFADQTFVKDIVKGVLHTIFFHRYFPPVRPTLYTPTASSSHSSSQSAQSLPIPLPAILDPPDISAAIDSHTALLVSQLTPQSSAGPAAGGSRGEVVVRFFDRKRRKTGITTGWLGRLGGGGGQTEEEVCWEEWCVQVVVARPRSEADRIKVRRAMESSLQKTAMKIVAIVNRDKDHIPPITTSDQNPFPYKIFVNPKQQETAERGFGGWN
ncbi:hypothetical protein LTR99_000985 [Exophiala xenobiotica]|uniref:Autophagy-related protein 101 n=1 Tax=Vermiconidia calcicola TaxID=1690605 RepID=A0AAV9QK70_9PEZI|nr:hypothetical protein H2202_002205 [Exophiala xenobiotica]KAK5540670.1 hypothetical protein LTR23_005901 [Chaetothyriales sp. CCFEE 6169]KAK5545548.1 hypothetical protein LTR25_000555 [Vermiconidia calcicola]KAK5198946.1 hypothetical protein LTR92_001417 [Exophiala xenobiotica]KAK5208466.1 hypothetical protein LTR41_005692 [Exophiala xenobiotica]